MNGGESGYRPAGQEVLRFSSENRCIVKASASGHVLRSDQAASAIALCAFAIRTRSARPFSSISISLVSKHAKYLRATLLTCSCPQWPLGFFFFLPELLGIGGISGILDIALGLLVSLELSGIGGISGILDIALGLFFLPELSGIVDSGISGILDIAISTLLTRIITHAIPKLQLSDFSATRYGLSSGHS
jgi:hypothetical protein